MSRKKLAWANKEVETFVCILGEEDVVYDVYVDAAAIDIRPTTKGLHILTVHIQNDRGRGQGIVLLADASAIMGPTPHRYSVGPLSR
ncbi:unnamed protein product [Boreogadus saida]